MISPLMMACKQMSEFEKGQIVAYNGCELSLYDIAKKLNCHHWSIDVFLKKENWKLSSQKGCVTSREKPLHLMPTDTQPNIKWSKIVLTYHKLHQLSSIVLIKISRIVYVAAKFDTNSDWM